MGTDAVTSTQSFRVHGMMCTKLTKLVGRISNILPEIENARPGSPEGREALCNLSNGIEKATLLIQSCRESSKLYLALTGDKIIARCYRIGTLLEHSLRKIKNMVPMALAVKISQIADDLRSATFNLDPSEEETRKTLRELLHQGTLAPDAIKSNEIRALKIAALRLDITSSKEMLFETRSIQKLLMNIDRDDPPKKKILMYLLHLLKKYGHLILQEIKDSHSENSRNNGGVKIGTNVGYGNNGSQADVLNMAIPPDEFKCPISLRLMYDPVFIASGLTYERVWIEKWFEEGNDTCPKSKMKLPNLLMTPNVNMKSLISKWCIKFGVTIPDPSVEPEFPEFWENSIASFGSSMNDIRLPIDYNSISLGGLDSYYPDLLTRTSIDALSLKSAPNNDDLQQFQPNSNVEERELKFLSNLGELTWEAKCKVIEDMKNSIDENDGVCPTLTKTIMDQFVTFLTYAWDQQDFKAQKNGCDLLLSLLRKSRSKKLNVPEKILATLASLLNSEVTREVLAILEILSGNRKSGHDFIASGVLNSTVEFLDSKIKDLQECAIKIFYNLSSNDSICSHIVSSGCVPKLLPMLNDEDLSGKCVFILSNLCHTGEASMSITRTNGCIASIARLLEMGSLEDQEHAVTILLSLCSQRVEYCELVMAEGVIPPLCCISINGSEKAKAGAFELLRLLKDVSLDDEQESHMSESNHPSSNAATGNTVEKKPSKKSGFFGMNISIFSNRIHFKK